MYNSVFESWKKFIEGAPGDLPDDMKMFVKKVYYLGALSTFNSIGIIMTNERATREEKMKMIKKFEEDLEGFWSQIKENNNVQ
jgi:hypothetical protein